MLQGSVALYKFDVICALEFLRKTYRKIKIYYYIFFLHIYTFKTKKYNYQVRKYQCNWDPSKKGLNKEQRMIISENIS